MSQADHRRAVELVPWLVNGTLTGHDLQWLNEHLEHCAECRAELAQQRLVRSAVARQPVVELAPQASFKNLWARIEAEANAPAAAIQPPATARARGTRWNGQLRVAAGVAAVAAAGVLLWWTGAPGLNRQFHTVSSAPAPASAAQLRVVFADSATIGDVKLILANAHLESVAGPTPAGVFTLQASGATADLDAPLRTLRADPRVRFAELR